MNVNLKNRINFFSNVFSFFNRISFGCCNKKHKVLIMPCLVCKECKKDFFKYNKTTFCSRKCFNKWRKKQPKWFFKTLEFNSMGKGSVSRCKH